MIGATLFSGIGAPECAMPKWSWPWHAEIEKFPSAVMAVRHPKSINLGDVNEKSFIKRAKAAGQPDVVVFGSPCQSFSVAGRRLGLDDPRGNLALRALRIIKGLGPAWFVFENVPGLLSSADGRDFGLFLRTVDELGYSLAWTVLDAQWFGVAQRRARVFAVGYIGDWRGPAAVLFEPAGVCGDSPPCREAGKGTPTGAGGSTAFGGNNTQGPIDIATAVNAHGGPHGRQDFESETFITNALRGMPLIAGTICKDSFVGGAGGRPEGAAQGHFIPVGPLTITANNTVRRLTPRECERLQGFPDDYTAVTYRGKPVTDGPRYKALGNSMAVPVIRWILERIEKMSKRR